MEPNLGRVLVVDDEPDVRQAVRRLLERTGHQVYPAANGREALEMLRSLTWCELIVLDLMMPVLDGYETLERLREGGFERIPVILLTAKFSPLEIARGHDAGANLFVRKPFKPIALLNAVSYLLCETAQEKSGSNARATTE
ncbi:MAG: response regulator transcription factor [Planctomycetota bacterium]|nr:response regulator transcription factor [Planctomycetota bacterium]